jgi:chromosome segregation ATPase
MITTPLETQRWLAKKELEIYRELLHKNRALNIVAPEIVETAAAYEEFKRREPEILKEERRVLRDINQSITADIRDIKGQLSQLHAKMFQSKRMIDAASIQVEEARRLLYRNTGWKRFLLGSTDLRSKEALEAAVHEAEAKLLALQSAQTELEKLESHLRERHRRAYNNYPKNSDRYMRRMALFSGLTPKKKPRIR